MKVLQRSFSSILFVLMPLDVGLGITAAMAFGSKFIERSRFSSRHDAIHDKELEKSSKAAEGFQGIPKEDVDFFEAEEYNFLHAKSMDDLMKYRSAQDEYKEKEWFREPSVKFQLRGRVREAKRRLQSSVSRERGHVDELETYSRSVHSRSSSVRSFASGGSACSGLDLDRSRCYRTDSLSIRAVNHSPPSASLEDVSRDEIRDIAHDHVSQWLSSVPSPLTTAQQFAESYKSRSPNSRNPAVVEDSGKQKPALSKPARCPPHIEPSRLYFEERIRTHHTSGTEKFNFARVHKEARNEYSLLSPADKEPYECRSRAMRKAWKKEREAYVPSLSEDTNRENAFQLHNARQASRERPALKKPLNAYSMFLQQIRANPELVTSVFGDESETRQQNVLASAKWRSMTYAERYPFLAQAKDQKMEYLAARQVCKEG